MRIRMVLLVLLMILVLTVTVAFIVLHYNYSSAKAMVDRYNRQLALDTMESLDIKNKKYGEVSLQIAMSPLVQEQLPLLLDARMDEAQFLAFKAELAAFLNQYYYTSDEIESIRVWFGDERIIFVGESRLKGGGGYEQQAGYQAARESPSHLAWVANSNRTLSQWHVITSFQGKLGPNNSSANPVIGAVEINMKPQRLLESMDKLKVIPGVRFSYVNTDYSLLFQYPEDGQAIDAAELLPSLAGSSEGVGDSEGAGGRLVGGGLAGNGQTVPTELRDGGYAYYIERSYLGVYLLISYPVETFLEYIAVAGKQVALIAFIVLLLSLLGVIYISNMTTRPLRIVLSGIKAFGEGKLEEKVPPTGIRELDLIGSGLNRMARQIYQLLESQVHFKQVEHDLEMKNKQAELRALRNQINPHFLFNTLQSIHSVALRKTRQETEINRMIIHLSKLLRESIYNIGNNVPVEHELNNLWAYVELQQYRFRGKFRVKWELDYDSLPKMLPCLVLQPIMENAIQHGTFHAERDEVLITVRSRYSDGLLVLEVRDEGCGMQPDALERLRTSLSGSEMDWPGSATGPGAAPSVDDEARNVGDGPERRPDQSTGQRPNQGGAQNGVGLANTHNRLKYEFGPLYSLQIDSVPNVGTTVRIAIRDCGDPISD